MFWHSILTFLASCLTFCSNALFRPSIWHLFWHPIWHPFLSFFLASVLTFFLAFYLAFYLASILTFWHFWHSSGQYGIHSDTQPWAPDLSCDPAWSGPTEIWSSWWEEEGGRRKKVCKNLQTITSQVGKNNGKPMPESGKAGNLWENTVNQRFSI